MKRAKLYHDVFYGIRKFGSTVLQEHIRVLSKREFIKFIGAPPLKSDLTLLSYLFGRQVFLLLLQNTKVSFYGTLEFLAKYSYFRTIKCLIGIGLTNAPHAFFSVILESAYDGGHFQLPQFHRFLDHYDKVFLSKVLICTANAKEIRETLPQYFCSH